MSFEDARVMAATELGTALDREVAGVVGDAPPLVSIHVDRKSDDDFEVTVMVSIATSPTTTRQAGTWTLRRIDLMRLRAVVSWASAKHAKARATFAKWPGWSTSHEANARELARVFDAVPTHVTVWRGMPTSERGEPATGQPSIVLMLDAHGLEIETCLHLEYTAEEGHAGVLATVTKTGEALANSLGVRCDIG